MSLLLDLKVPPHIAHEMAGHSDNEVTTAIAHASLDEKRAALRKPGKPSAEHVAARSDFGSVG